MNLPTASSAGVASNLVLLVPVVLLHAWSPESSALAQWCSLMLVVYNAVIVCNLLPLPRIDGYLLVSVGLGRPELKEEAFAAVRALAAGRWCYGPVGSSGWCLGASCWRWPRCSA